MALPVTISGLAVGVACCGPFKSGAGNYYFFGADSGTPSALDAYKATDPTSSFSQQATVSVTSAITVIAGFKVGDVIHLAISGGAGSSCAYRYVTFDMSADTFGSVEAIQTGLTIAGQSAALPVASIVVRSDNTVVVIYQGAQVSFMGTARARIVYARRASGGGWTTNIAVDAGGAVDYGVPECVLGSSDRSHFLWHENGATQSHRTLTSANSLQTASTSSGVFSGGTNSQRTAISYDDGGTIRVVQIGLGPSSNIAAIRFDSGDTPTLNTTSGFGSTIANPYQVFHDDGVVYAIARNTSDSDLDILSSSDDGASFGSQTEIFAASIASGGVKISIDGAVYQRGSDFVIPYVVDDGGTLKYNEHVVRSVSPTSTGALSLLQASIAAAAAETFPGAGAIALSGLSISSAAFSFETVDENLFDYSEDFTQSYWADKSAVTISADATTAPDGETTADKLVETTDTAGHYVGNFGNAEDEGLGVYTFSIYAKAAERFRGQLELYFDVPDFNDVIRVDFNLSAGTVSNAGNDGDTVLLSAAIESAANGFYRISVTGSGSSASSLEGYFYIHDDANFHQYAGDAAKGMYFWGAQLNRGGITTYIRTPSAGAAVSGTAAAGITEEDVVDGGKTVIITLTGDTWITSAGGLFDLIRQDIIDGLDSAQSEATGWNNEVRDNQGVAGVVRTSDTVVTITLDAQVAYNITAQETITVTVPITALTIGIAPITATPAFTVDDVVVTTSTGAAVLLGLSIAASAAESIPSAGDIDLSGVQISAVGAEIFTGTGDIDLTGVSIAAVGTHPFVGAATITLFDVDIVAAGEETFAGSGDIDLIGVSLAGAGAHPFVGTGAVVLLDVDIAATGEETFAGAGAIVLPQIILAGAGSHSQEYAGAGAIGLSSIVLLASGQETIDGTGTVVLLDVDIAAAGEETFAGAGAIVLDDAVIAAAGFETFVGAGAIPLSQAVLSAAGFETFVGSGAIVLSDVEINATGAHPFVGAGAIVLFDVDIATSGSAGIVSPEGTGAILLSSVQVSAAGAETILGAGDIDLFAIQIAAAGAETIPGVGDIDLLAIQIAAAGAEMIPGAGDLDLLAIQIAAAGAAQEIISASGDIDLSGIQISGSGAVFSPAGAITLNAITMAAAGLEIIPSVGAIVLSSIVIETLGIAGELILPRVPTAGRPSLVATGVARPRTSGVPRPRVEGARR